MPVPHPPVERIPPSAFHPPHCPWHDCPDHHARSPRAYRAVRNGFFRRKCDRRRVQRFLCRRCDRGFSQQTFAVSYYAKRPELIVPIATSMTSGTPLRRIARALHHAHPFRPCHPATVVRLARRVGSQCLLVLDQLRHELRLTEPVAFDHFETFVGNQENALGVVTPVGHASGFTYALEPAWHRRATARSRRRRAVSETPGAYRESVRRTIRSLVTRVPAHGTLRLASDDHGEYPKAIADHDGSVPIRHVARPNPRDRRKGRPRDAAARARDAALFQADQVHTWFRHVDADHRRESISFCRRGEAVLERLAAVVAGKNLIQGTERRGDPTTPAMKVGLTDRPWLWAEVLGRRRWPERIGAGRTTRAVLRRSIRDPRGIAWPEHVRKRSL